MKTPQSPGRFGQARKGVLHDLPGNSGAWDVPGDMAIMSTIPVCAGRDDKGCSTTSTVPTLLENVDWLEKDVAGFRVWQIMFMSFAGVLALVIFLCCCIRFRIPRTKQEIEADYVRKKITRKFKKHLRFIQNSEMDDMDLKRALDRVRAEFKSDTESIAPSEALSGATLSSGCNCPLPGPEEPRDAEGGKGHLLPPSADDNTYCKGSDILIGDEEEEHAEVPQKGIGAKFATLVENTLVKFRAKKSPVE